MPSSHIHGKLHFSCCVSFSCSSCSWEQAGGSELCQSPLFIQRRQQDAGVFWKQGFLPFHQAPCVLLDNQVLSSRDQLRHSCSSGCAIPGRQTGTSLWCSGILEVPLPGFSVQRNVEVHGHSLSSVLPLVACPQLKHTLVGFPVQRETLINAEMFF